MIKMHLLLGDGYVPHRGAYLSWQTTHLIHFIQLPLLIVLQMAIGLPTCRGDSGVGGVRWEEGGVRVEWEVGGVRRGSEVGGVRWE